MAKNKNQGAPDSVRTIITILLLALVVTAPIGILVMWFWARWKEGVKIAITITFGFAIFVLPILLSVVIIAINPRRQFAQANNTQRRSDVGAILNAIHQYSANHKGQMPPGTPIEGDMVEDISSTTTGSDFCNALVPSYIAKLPTDPKKGSYTNCNEYDTTYQISVSPETAAGPSKIIITAPNAELKASISASR